MAESELPLPPAPSSPARGWPGLCEAGEPESVAIAFDSGSALTYADLRRATRERLGGRPAGERRLMALVATASPASLMAYVSALAAGDAVVLLPPDQPALLQRVLERFDPNELATDGAQGWTCTVRHAQPLDLHPDLALLLSTSGSTGEAKFVRLSYGNLMANAASIAEYLGLDPTERGLMNLPLHCSYGVSIVHSHLSVGARVLVSERSVTDEALWRFFDAQGGTSVPGVPHSVQLLEASGFFERQHPTLRMLTQAGGRLDPALARRVADWAAARGVWFFIMYGQTEASPRIAYLPPEMAREHYGCIGRAIPGGTLRLVDDQGHPIEAVGVEGELQYRGPNVMMGYATGAADLARPPGEPVLATGDLAVLEPSGLFRITGRRSRFVKLFGLRISTDEVERQLERAGIHAACAGRDDFLGLLVTGDARRAEAAAAQVAATLNLPPSMVVALAAPGLPRLPTGKVDHRQALALLQAEHERRRVAAERAVGAVSHTPAGRVRAAFEAAFPGCELLESDTFTTLGGDSLRYVSVAVTLERLVPDLPRRWEPLTLGELQRLAERARVAERASGAPAPRWQRLDTGICLRALAVVLVVIAHLDLTMLEGGAALLLPLAGANFARFQGPHLARGEWQVVARGFVLHVLVPYWIVAGAYGLLRGGLHWPDLLLVGDYFIASGIVGSSGFEAWFVQVLAQAMPLIVLVTRIPAVRRGMTEQPWQWSLALLALGVAARVLEPVWFPQLAVNGGRELTWQFWVFALGLVVFAADTPTARRWTTLLVVLLPAALYANDPSRMTILSGGLLLLLWREHLSVPVAAAAGLRTLAASSLFIYMLHGRAPVGLPTADWPVDVLRIGVGLLLGVAGWAAYEWLGRRVSRAWQVRRRGRDRPVPDGLREASSTFGPGR